VRLIAVNRFYWPDHSASSQLLTDLARHLARRGHDVTVVTCRQRYDDPKADLPAREVSGGVQVHRVWTTRLGRDWLPGRALDYATFYLSALIALWRLAGPGDVVLAKTDPPLVSVVAGWATRGRGARLVTWQQDLFPEVAAALGLRWAAGPLGRALVALRNRSLRQADDTVVLNDRMAERLAAARVTAGVHVVANWSDGEIRPVPHDRNPLRRGWGLADRFVVGYSGNLGRAHLADAVADLVAATAELERLAWLFVGAGAGLDRLRARLAGPADVRFRPYQPRARLSASLSVPDVHLVSLDPACEGLIMPSKLYGILAAGRPVAFLGDPDGAVAREVHAFGLGVVLALDRPASWAPTLAGLRDDAAARAAMGRRARARFERAYRPERALARWEALLSDGAAGRDVPDLAAAT